jgi:hypothetical protein
MKKTHVIICYCLMVMIYSFASCTDNVKLEIEGIYASPFRDSIDENSYTVGVDTIRIFKQTASGSETYQVDRSMKFTQTIDSVAQPEQTKQESWMASYMPADKTLYVKNTGKSIAFDVKNKLAIIGSKKYKKIE